MGRFTNAVLLGIGISFLFAPQSGRETRHFLKERFNSLRGNPPENEEMKQKAQQMSARVEELQQQASQTAQLGTTVQNSAQETAKNAYSVQNDLNDVAQQTDLKQRNRSGKQRQ